jgi:nicotinate-nucleotide adenylyltransferase
VGLYFGTFNPIHVGHLVIANYMAEFTDLDQVWLVVSPQNPLKQKNTLLPDIHRLALVQVAIEDNGLLRACDVEFKLPKPSYTIVTLEALREKHPGYEFSLIMGEDNLRTLHRWRNYDQILEKYHLYVYPRPLTESEIQELMQHPEQQISHMQHSNIHICDAPVMKVSSSFIRKAIHEGKDVRYLVTDPVYRYIEEMHFYK